MKQPAPPLITSWWGGIFFVWNLTVSVSPYSLVAMGQEFHSKTDEPLTRADYGRHPYVLLSLDDGRQFEGRASAWTPTLVCVTWVDPDRPPEVYAGVPVDTQTAWFDASQVRRLKRSDVSKPDPYDDYSWDGETV